jgi:tetratricopeptide (TPR) repeat protein
MNAETATPANNWPFALQQALADYFSLDELRDLCLRLEVDFDELGEGAKSRRILALMRHMVANKRLGDLLDQCEALRPGIGIWANIRAAAGEDPKLFDRQLEAIGDDGDFIQLSGDFSGATIHIGSNPLAEFFRSARNRRLAVAGLLAILLIAGAGVLYSMGVFEPEPVPDKMEGNFNIAVAEFAVLDESGRLTNDQHQGGRRLAERVAANLRLEVGEVDGVEIWNDSPALAADHHVTIGVAAEGVAGARPPVEVTADLGADALIYGRVEPATNLSRQSLRFYLAPQFGQDFTNMVGNYVFSASIPVFDPARPAEEVWRELDPLSRALAWLLLGLRQERLGETGQALASFERAAAFVPDADIVHFFIGQENLFLAQKSEGETALEYEASAESAFTEALRLNPNNARATIGLGSVQALRAQRLLNTAKSPDFEGDAPALLVEAMAEARRALATYQPVVDQPQQTEVYGLPVSSIASLGQGIALRILGDAAYRVGDAVTAEQAIDTAIRTLESALNPLEETRDYRLMAQVTQALGTVYEWKGFLLDQVTDPSAEETYGQAVAYFERCRELGEEFPIDIYLTDRIVAQLCLPRLQALQRRTSGE